MDEPKSLNILYKQKIFRIPDYQRGYAWQRELLKVFWEDLVKFSRSPRVPVLCHIFTTHAVGDKWAGHGGPRPAGFR